MSEARNIAKGNPSSLGESFLVDCGMLKTRVATDPLIKEPKRFNTVLQPKIDDLEKIEPRLVAMHASRSNGKSSRIKARIGKVAEEPGTMIFCGAHYRITVYKKTLWNYQKQRGDACGKVEEQLMT